MNYYLAIDIGASSGRHIVGYSENGEIKTDEVYRFQNGVEKIGGSLVWDTDGLFENVVRGIAKAFEKYKTIKSLAIDTWGVDYVLMQKEKAVLPCYSYRDGRTERAVKEVHRLMPFEELYRRTGIQFQPFNTVYQLYDDKMRGRLEGATDFLMIPEYLNYRLTGVKLHEYTNATTTGLVNAKSHGYDKEIISALSFPAQLFQTIGRAGECVGNLKEEIAKEVGGQTQVVLCASHDTASAVEGIPMRENSPYVSSGTWSLLGLKVPEAITDANSRKANYSNEGGAGYFRYQKNIMGMWIVNRLKEELCPDATFCEIVDGARKSQFFRTVDVNDKSFVAPESMKEAFDRALKGDAPKTQGDYFRCAFHSLSVSYRQALDELKQNSGANFRQLYIVGGGAKNGFLNELTEEVCNVKVVALPIEATALGNLKIQIQRGENHV